MQTVYDTLKDASMILADHDANMAEKYRNLMRGHVVTGTDSRNKPVYSKIPYVLRSMVYVDPDTTVSKQGTFSMALPAVIERDGNRVLVKVLRDGGVKEAKLKGIEDWQLPSGGKGNLVDGQGGVLVVGTEIDSNKKIFIPSGGGGKGGGLDLIAAHRNRDATDGSSAVSDLTADGEPGLQALLSEAFWVTKRPAKVDAELRNAVALNSFSAGVRSGKFLEHQGGAVVLYNSNIRSLEGNTQPPKVTAWSAWLDDGPYFEGEGAKDLHIKGVDSDGTPHLPLMYHKERAKFGPGPQRKPSAPFDFLEEFASVPVYSQRIYRAEIKYDRALKHQNPSGIHKLVEGRWVVEYRLPFQTPKEDPERTKTPTKDPQRKSPIDDPAEGKEDGDPVEDKSPRTVDPILDKGDADPITKLPVEDFPPTGVPITGTPSDGGGGEPGPGDSGGGPGTCGHPGAPAEEPGPGTGNGDGPGVETGSPGDEDSQAKHDSAIGKRKEANNSVSNGVTSNTQHPETQTNLNSSGFRQQPAPYAGQLVKPLWTHLQGGYPSIVGVVPTLETGGLTQRGILSSAEERAVDAWNFNSTQLATFGDVRKPAVVQRVDNDRKTVKGGFVVAGANLTPPQIYDDTKEGIEAILALRPESSIQFGVPELDGTVKSPVIIKDDSTAKALQIRKRNDVGGVDPDLEYTVHFQSPLELTKASSLEINSIPAIKRGSLIYDTDKDEIVYGNPTLINARFAQLASPVNLPKTMNGLNLSSSGAAVVLISSGSCTDSTKEVFITQPTEGLVVSFSNPVGSPGGPDAPIVLNNWYYVHVIYDVNGGSTTSAVLSLSDVAPALPPGYTHFRRIGSVRLGAAALVPFSQFGANENRTYMYTNAALTRLVAVNVPGVAGVWTAVNCATLIPPTAKHVDVNWFTTGGAAGIGAYTLLSGDGVTIHGIGYNGTAVGTAQGATGFNWLTFDGAFNVHFQYLVLGPLFSLAVNGYREHV